MKKWGQLDFKASMGSTFTGKIISTILQLNFLVSIFFKSLGFPVIYFDTFSTNGEEFVKKNYKTQGWMLPLCIISPKHILH